MDRIRSAYGARARDYIDFIASSGAASAGLDQDLIGRWAEQISGPVVDAGCGPGHWTQFLHERGLVVEGVDVVPEFLAHAAVRYPDATFGPAHLDDLPVDDASLGALLSWYSIIHTAPAQLPAVLAEFARCVRPGGSLLLGFCEGARLEPFDHAVVTAYFWPGEAMRSALDAAGFDVVETQRRTDPGTRPQAAMIARRRDRPATPVTRPPRQHQQIRAAESGEHNRGVDARISLFAAALAERRAQALAQRDALLAAIEETRLARSLTFADDEHDPDGSLASLDQARDSALLKRTSQTLTELAEAQRRLDSGRYGTCEACGRAIDPQRLLARPETRSCVACAARSVGGRRPDR